MNLKDARIDKRFLSKEELFKNIDEIFESSETGLLHLRFNDVFYKNFEFKNPHFFVYKDVNYDLIMIVNEEDFVKVGVSKMLEFVKSFSSLICGKNFYCGMEPSIDLETRFFTNNSIGPLKY